MPLEVLKIVPQENSFKQTPTALKVDQRACISKPTYRFNSCPAYAKTNDR